MTRIQTVKRLWWMFVGLMGLTILLVVSLPALTAGGADHLDAPFVTMDGRTDINDPGTGC